MCLIVGRIRREQAASQQRTRHTLTVSGFWVILSSTRAAHTVLVPPRAGKSREASFIVRLQYSARLRKSQYLQSPLCNSNIAKPPRLEWSGRLLHLALCVGALPGCVQFGHEREGLGRGRPAIHWLVSWCSVAKSASSSATSNS